MKLSGIIVIAAFFTLTGTMRHAMAQSALQMPQVLETFAVSGGCAFQLEVPECIKSQDKIRRGALECPIAVNLLENNEKIHRQFLPLMAHHYAFEEGPVSPDWSFVLYNVPTAEIPLYMVVAGDYSDLEEARIRFPLNSWS